MRSLTSEETKYVEILNTVAGEITQRIVSAADDKGNPMYTHLFEIWKAFMGGFVCRELADYIDLDDEQRAMLAEYTPEKIEKLLIRTETVYREKVVEVEKVKTVTVPVSSGSVTPAPGERRRPHSRTRGTEKDRPLSQGERLYMIGKFNEMQRLIDKDSNEAIAFADELNAEAKARGQKPIFPSQLAGYWSLLCRLVCGIGGNPTEYVTRNVKCGNLPSGCPLPQATDAFKKVILENLIASKAEAARIAEYQTIYRQTFGIAAPNP